MQFLDSMFFHLEATGNIPRFLYFLPLRLFSRRRCLHKAFPAHLALSAFYFPSDQPSLEFPAPCPSPENPHRFPVSHDKGLVFHNRSKALYYLLSSAGRLDSPSMVPPSPLRDFPDKSPFRLHNPSRAVHLMWVQMAPLPTPQSVFLHQKVFRHNAKHHFHYSPFLHRSHFFPCWTQYPDKFPTENRLCVNHNYFQN